MAVFGILAVAMLMPGIAGATQKNADSSPGMASISLVSGNMQRSYFIFVPSGASPQKALPLVFVFHGGGGDGRGIAAMTEFNALAERENFIVVYPNGVGRKRGGTWNAGGSPPLGYAEEQGIDDVGFVRDILSGVATQYRIDRHRIFATGLSKGGMFAYHLACAMPDVFSAIAPVAATMTAAECAPASPVSVLHIHGTEDKNVPLNGGAGERSRKDADYPPVMQTLQFWADFDHCRAPAEQTSAGEDYTCHEFPGCAAGDKIVYCLIEGGGHAWPGSTPRKRKNREDVYVSPFPATKTIWEFFRDTGMNAPYEGKKEK